ncbi:MULTISPECIES: hypothetical protein [Paenibacillus]|uniref:hypothetical protein n=1 Tax=Paenibacillus TaxID=44249 RepID=UPI0002DDA863|nr:MULTISPECIES: hypothetical protein [Paenibacillus]
MKNIDMLDMTDHRSKLTGNQDIFTETLLVRIAELINASPRERAEAAYMTLSSQDQCR